jgi:hypothetical protein
MTHRYSKPHQTANDLAAQNAGKVLESSGLHQLAKKSLRSTMYKRSEKDDAPVHGTATLVFK